MRSIFAWLRGLVVRNGGELAESITTHLPHFRHDFTPPPAILEQLRATDPTADLLYLGWGKWLLVSVRPNRDMMATGVRRLRAAWRLLHEWETGPKFKQNPGAFRRLYQRYLYWLAVSQGARPIADYPARFVRQCGFEAIVLDFRRMDWLHRTVTDNQLFSESDPHGLDYEKARSREEADAELRSEYRAMDAWRYAFGQLTHSVTRHDDPAKARGRSGFTTVAAIGADGTLRHVAS